MRKEREENIQKNKNKERNSHAESEEVHHWEDMRKNEHTQEIAKHNKFEVKVQDESSLLTDFDAMEKGCWVGWLSQNSRAYVSNKTQN